MVQVLGAALITIGVILFVLRPVLQGDEATLTSSDGGKTELDAQKKMIALKGLRDAEYDYQSGKLDKEDFQSLRLEMASEVLEIMEEVGRELHADVEMEIQRVREGLDAGLTCLSCGEVNRKGSYFCGQCGSTLE
ncbi:MAG TPA: hypothetical protein EYQ69_08780 [Gemmatimonadetes bacterium]|jgi:hypothetical protein|nr:hypothetical protein [Gemmatimonadota bacterium]